MCDCKPGRCQLTTRAPLSARCSSSTHHACACTCSRPRTRTMHIHYKPPLHFRFSSIIFCYLDTPAHLWCAECPVYKRTLHMMYGSYLRSKCPITLSFLSLSPLSEAARPDSLSVMCPMRQTEHPIYQAYLLNLRAVAQLARATRNIFTLLRCSAKAQSTLHKLVAVFAWESTTWVSMSLSRYCRICAH